MTLVLFVLLASRFDAPLPAASEEVLVGLAVLVVLELSVVFDVQDAPVAPVSAGVKDRLVWSQRTLPAADTPRSWVSPVSDGHRRVGTRYRLRERGRGQADREDAR